MNNNKKDNCKRTIGKKFKYSSIIVIFVILIFVCVFVLTQNKNKENKINKTICYFEYNEKDSDGIISRVNYNSYIESKTSVQEEQLAEYVFENDELALKYYREHIHNLEEYKNEVQLINNIMKIYNNKIFDVEEISSEEISSSIYLNEGLGSTCKKNDSLMIKKYNSEKKRFKNEKEKSEQYIISSNQNLINNNVSEKKEEFKESNNNSNVENNSNSEVKDDYMDALRKCSVMEAADIYNTGIGQKSDNVFNDGRETCEIWYKQWGEKEFIKVTNDDWENRKKEEVEGEKLSYYLDILGW